MLIQHLAYAEDASKNTASGGIFCECEHVSIGTMLKPPIHFFLAHQIAMHINCGQPLHL